MRAWQRLRARILGEAARLVEQGQLESAEDVFLLTRPDLAGSHPGPEEGQARRLERERRLAVDVPTTVTRDDLEAILAGGPPLAASGEESSLTGIGLGPHRFEGRVRRATDLVELLQATEAGEGPPLDAETILVVPALEPSWAVVFGRVGAVVTELGGELSHASILLREAGKPAIVNCAGVFNALRDGERVRLDGASGRVERLDREER
jgi:pyruvate,water dikinase